MTHPFGISTLIRVEHLLSKQQRPDLFALDIHKTDSFYRHILEVPEQINPDGDIIKP